MDCSRGLGGYWDTSSGLLISLGRVRVEVVCVRFIFGANALGFLIMFPRDSQWRETVNRHRQTFPGKLSCRVVTTADPLRALHVRESRFFWPARVVFFYSIIPSLMPVVGLKELQP